MNLINNNQVFLNADVSNKEDAFKLIAKKAVELGFCNNESSLVDAFKKRELESTTGFEDGIAIPHAKTNANLKPAIFLLRLKKAIDWKSMDGKPTKIAIAIIIPGKKTVKFDYLSVLAKLSTELINPEFRKNLKEIKDANKLADLINKVANAPKAKAKGNKIVAKTTNKDAKKQLSFVGITACPTGIAHTFMAAKKLTTVGESLGYNVKIETQGAEGVGTKLTDKDIEAADAVIIAADVNVTGMERFAGKRVLYTKVAAPLKDTKGLFDQALSAPIEPGAGSGNGSDNSSFIERQRQKSKTGPMQHLMSGVSYMIPFVVCGGLLLAISLGIGATIDPKTHAWVFKNDFWNVINIIGVSAFTLMIPILGGYIANSIGGRSAIAPTMILSMVIGNGSGNYTGKAGQKFTDLVLFNWNHMSFGTFSADNPAHAGFFGAIAIGFLVGYGVKFWYQFIKLPAMIKPIEPIIIIPILFTLTGWVFFAFFGYWPLYELSKGIKSVIEHLIAHNLLFIVGMILGAMVAFDMGGPINKVAFLLGSVYIGRGQPEIMGMVAAAIAVPPLGNAIGTLVGRFIFKLRFDKEDESNATAALGMGMFGITEGAIPFAVKYPKFILANVVGGAVASAIAALFMFGDNAAHGGPIVYFVGAIGHAIPSGLKDGKYLSATNYGYGLLYLVTILIGSLTTATIIIGIKHLEDRKAKKQEKLEAVKVLGAS